MTDQKHIDATRWLNETYVRMRESEELEGTVITWGPGWMFAGMRSRVEQDDGEASLAIHEIDFGDSVASLDIAHVFASGDNRSHCATVGIELTAGDVRLLAARLTEIASRFCVECDRNLDQPSIAIALSPEEIAILRSALDSAEYWEHKDDLPHDSGYIYDPEPGSEEEESEAWEEVQAIRALDERLRALEEAVGR